MNARIPVVDTPKREAMRIAGEKVHTDRVIEIRYPYTGEVIATVPKASRRRREARLSHRAPVQADAVALRALQDPDEGRRPDRRAQGRDRAA